MNTFSVGVNLERKLWIPNSVSENSLSQQEEQEKHSVAWPREQLIMTTIWFP